MEYITWCHYPLHCKIREEPIHQQKGISQSLPLRLQQQPGLYRGGDDDDDDDGDDDDDDEMLVSLAEEGGAPGGNLYAV